ncbi:hypothetical protein Pan189_03570 [Stratiformator vulcanicus]|uniref:Uncharacterized protein n=1 Tax=Stratiformator vulcanicus TaxID=2527980 RepID=A0A517QWF7_9PLAN|nr:hypothetical protein Pan189_03570 [Stratiformator vulcanicus]
MLKAAADAKVASAKRSRQITIRRRSAFASNLRQASSKTLALGHSLWRRQHVAELGYRGGRLLDKRAFHRAPLLKIHRMPSRQPRGSTLGRPSSSDGGESSNRSRINSHWKSLRSGCGAVLDPVVFGRRREGHEDRVMSKKPPLGGQSMQLACQTVQFNSGFETTFNPHLKVQANAPAPYFLPDFRVQHLGDSELTCFFRASSKAVLKMPELPDYSWSMRNASLHKFTLLERGKARWIGRVYRQTGHFYSASEFNRLAGFRNRRGLIEPQAYQSQFPQILRPVVTNYLGQISAQYRHRN